MKIFNFLMVASCLLTINISAQESNGNAGSYKLEVFELDEDDEDDGDSRSQSQNRGNWGLRGIGHAYLNNQICQAIQNHSRIEMVLKNKEVVNAKEVKITTKQLTVEPYAFGMTPDGVSVLKGNIVNEKNLKEVTIKVFEDLFNEKNKSPYTDLNRKGWFKTDTGVHTFALHGVRGLRLVPNSRFDAPKDFKGFEENKDIQIQTVCSLPIGGSEKNLDSNGYYKK